MLDISTDIILQSVERWMAHDSRRNIAKLSRVTGVPDPTLRRLLRGDCEASLETKLSILQAVASPEEFSSLIPEGSLLRKILQKLSPEIQAVNKDNSILFAEKNKFWILMLSFTVGATHARVEKLLGSFGLTDFEALIDDGVLGPDGSGNYRPVDSGVSIHIENKTVACNAVIFIAEAAAKLADGKSSKRFFGANVSEAGHHKIDKIYTQAFLDARDVAEAESGDIFIVCSSVVAEVQNSEGASK